jgi:hypothetical protein
MAKPKNTDSPNADIDDMISKMRKDFDTFPPDVKINTIKIAIAWEKTKKDIKEGGEGEFFNDSDED